MEASGRLVATDINRIKVDALKTRLTHPQLEIRIHDGRLPMDATFDRILLDAPCSALGLVRRHPEIRWRRTPENITTSAKLQADLLENAAGHLKTDGLLVYSVCSDMVEEGPEVVSAFLERHPHFTLESPTDAGLSSDVATQDFLYMTPEKHGSDGFFAARLRRTAETGTPAVSIKSSTPNGEGHHE